MKFCTTCGAKMEDDALYCPACGAAAPVKNERDVNQEYINQETYGKKDNAEEPRNSQSTSYQQRSQASDPWSSQPQSAPKPIINRVSHKSRLVAALLAWFLGGFGIHQFYLGKTGQGIAMLLFCWTGIPAIIAFIQFIIILCGGATDSNGDPVIYWQVE